MNFCSESAALDASNCSSKKHFLILQVQVSTRTCASTPRGDKEKELLAQEASTHGDHEGTEVRYLRPMGTTQEWAEAENALLGVACTFTSAPNSLRFESGQDTRRFNGVRILDLGAQSAERWSEELGTHAEAFAAREMPLSVQLAQPLEGKDLPGDWRATGPTYHHLATDLADFVGESEREIQMREVDGESDICAFAEMMMVDRIPEAVREQARPSIEGLMRRVSALPQSSMMLVYDGDDMIGQVALVRAEGADCEGYNVSTLSVDQRFRGRGYMKALYAAIGKTFRGQLYGQIIEGKPTMFYRRRFPSTRHLATVQTYQRARDPFGERWDAGSLS